MSDKGVCSTVPATPSMLITSLINSLLSFKQTNKQTKCDFFVEDHIFLAWKYKTKYIENQYVEKRNTKGKQKPVSVDSPHQHWPPSTCTSDNGGKKHKRNLKDPLSLYLIKFLGPKISGGICHLCYVILTAACLLRMRTTFWIVWLSRSILARR